MVFVETLVLRARPSPSSSNQFEKRQSQCDCDKAAEAIFPVDFPALTAFTRKCICARATCVTKTAVRVPFSRIVSFARAPQCPPHKISARNPKTMTVSVLYSWGKIDSKQVLASLRLTQDLCVTCCTHSVVYCYYNY